MQHYAALGRDKQGGASVNLIPAEAPADVYTGIANILKNIVSEDARAADGVDATDDAKYVAALATALAPHVDRKLVKQTVMTSVYGVTYVGARQQIQNRLKERGAEHSEANRYAMANYAARRTLDALQTMFTNARAVMEWCVCATVWARACFCVQCTVYSVCLFCV